MPTEAMCTELMIVGSRVYEFVREAVVGLPGAAIVELTRGMVDFVDTLPEISVIVTVVAAKGLEVLVPLSYLQPGIDVDVLTGLGASISAVVLTAL